MEVVEGLPPLVCEHVLSMQLMYYDNITPLTYEPPFFAPASKHILDINPQGQKSSIDIATLDTGHHVLSVTIKHPFFEQLRSHLSASTTGCERARSLTDVCSSRKKEESAAVRSEKEGKKGPPATVFHVGSNGGTLRSVEVAFLVFASFVVTKSPVVGRGRVTTREIEEYLRVSCPLEIQMEDVKHMMHQLEERGVVTPETSFEWSVSAPKSSEIAKVVIAEPDVVPLLSAQTRVELQRLTGGPGKARVSAAKSSRKRVRA
uniref:Uncharacterized protein TCIL3000_10_4620 n=1 Tax=Trypanosoma congolense (strain IL3000) TaxID=1068625 RepID=G0UWD3_TRYCI|nr:unnamed protein product [Trypanosoma congolense IL3000]